MTLKHWLPILIVAICGAVAIQYSRLPHGDGPHLVSGESAGRSPLAVENIRKAAFDAFVHWFDDIQMEDVSIFDRSGQKMLPDTEACKWVTENRESAAEAVKQELKVEVGLGNAVLAGYLDLKDTVPDIIEGWIHRHESPYNGESAIEGEADLSYFRELQGIAYVIEHLTGKPLREAVILTDQQRQYLLSQSASDDSEAAKAILAALE